MEVVIPVHTMDFDFSSAKASPCIGVPSTPKRFGNYYFSAPTSPTKLSQFYQDFEEFLNTNLDDGERGGRSGGSNGCSCLAVPFDWEEKPGTPKSKARCADDFAFDVIKEPERTSVSAEELFDGGMIKPLKPPPKLQLPVQSRLNESLIQKSPSPISHGRRIISNAFSPRQKKGIDPFAAASEKTRKEPENERGRERHLSSSGRRGARSLSPFRVSRYPWEEEQQAQLETTKQNSSKPQLPANNTSSFSSSSSKGQRKWSFKDFFLFRSASEGRAANKDPLRKYTAVVKKQELDVKNSSFRGYESPKSRQSSRRKGKASAHELHYTANRAVSEDLKKKTFLPYKQGILGRLAFNPTVHALSNGFGFSRKRGF